jgi:type II secretory pathway pseudopilin PulG
MGRLRARLAGTGSESGLTLIELLVASAMSVVLVGAACAMLISAVQDQPKLSKKAQNISTARYVLERMTREIRNGIFVYEGTGSRVSFLTQVRRTACGGGVEEEPSAPAIKCRVTYSCTTTSCTRTETDPAIEGEAGTPTTIASGLDSSNVFNYEPDSEEADYVGVTLHIPNPEGSGDLVVSDGAGLRTRTLLDN